ncbi:MAG: hypothetical protein WCJ25_04165 [Candidatus Moraniibacteriota bacterium]
MNPVIFNALFLALIAVVGTVVIIGDLARTKISNVVLGGGFVAGLSLYVIALAAGAVSVVSLGTVAVNTVCALAVGYAFWAFNFWPAGDAKLFALLAFLLPLDSYRNGFLSLFPSLALLVNIFVCAYAYLIVRSFLYAVRRFFRWNPFVENYTLLFQRFVFSVRKGLFRRGTIRVALRNALLMTGVLILMRYGSGSDWSTESVRVLFTGMVLWMAVSFSVRKYIADKETRTIPHEALEAGMSPVIALPEDGLFTKAFLRTIGPLRAEGFDERQVGLVKDRAISEHIPTLRVQRHTPFSPWILIGASVTVLLGGSLLRFLERLSL